jgi:hypothetical protein
MQEGAGWRPELHDRAGGPVKSEGSLVLPGEEPMKRRNMMKSIGRTVGSIAAAGAFMLAVAPCARAALITTTYNDYAGVNTVLVRFSGGTGTWTVPDGVTSLQLLVVGGGSGGHAENNNWSRSGGGGGAYYTTAYSVSSGATLDVAVGIGSAGGYLTSLAGGDSSFGTGSTTVIAYGGGGTTTDANGATRGYGGGYSLDNGATGPLSRFSGVDQSGGGAGGSPVDGVGGNGIFSPIVSEAFALANGLPYDQGYYGGGGGRVQNGNKSGGLGGGGNGGTSAEATAGIDGLGGGGGGRRGTTEAGYDGGDGVVYVAYIPEPGSGLLLVGAMVLIGVIRRKLRG